MPRTTVHFDLTDTIDETFDRPIEMGMVALLVFGPLALGAVQPWSETIFVTISLALGLMLAIKLICRPEISFIRSWTYWPIGVFMLLVVLQLVSLPAGLMRVISPQTFAIKENLLNDLPDAPRRLRWMTLSFYPEATLHDLRLLAAVTVDFIVALNVLRSLRQMKRMLGAIAVIGAGFALLSLTQIVSGTHDIYWLIHMPTGQPARSGSFIHHTHFGQGMNLSIGAAGGLLLVLIHEQFRRDDYTFDEVVAKLRSAAMRPAWGLMGMIALGAAAVAMSLSRGALLSMMIAGAPAGVILATRRGVRGRGWILGAVIVAAALVALLDSQRILERMQTSTTENLHGNRLEILRDLRPTWGQFPIFGTGLGTFAAIFPMYDRSDLVMFATHAENEYAQLLTETGAIGMVCMLAFVGMLAMALAGTMRGAISPASSMALGLGFAWCAILINSVSDFGQHIPAVAALSAVCAAMLLNLSQLRSAELTRSPQSAPPPARLGGRIGAAALLAIAGAGIIWNGIDGWRADESWQVVQRIESDLQQRDWIAPNAEYADILEAADRAAQIRPGNIVYRYWLNFYRWKSITRIRDAESGQPILNGDAVLHIRRIVDELRAARWNCPTYGPVYLLAGQLERNYLDDRFEQAQIDLKRAYTLSGPDPVATMVLGEMAMQAGGLAESVRLIDRALKLNPALGTEVPRGKGKVPGNSTSRESTDRPLR